MKPSIKYSRPCYKRIVTIISMVMGLCRIYRSSRYSNTMQGLGVRFAHQARSERSSNYHHPIELWCHRSGNDHRGFRRNRVRWEINPYQTFYRNKTPTSWIPISLGARALRRTVRTFTFPIYMNTGKSVVLERLCWKHHVSKYNRQFYGKCHHVKSTI